MKNIFRFTELIAIGLVMITTAALATEGVSPGALDRMTQVNNACPTFSWGMSGDAVAYDLIAYLLPDDAAHQAELTADNEVLFTRVAGSATSWTPSADLCFAPGGRYVWFVRAVNELAGDEVVAASEWSAGRYFTVSAAPSVDDVSRALEVLQRYVAQTNDAQVLASTVIGSSNEGPLAPLKGGDMGGLKAVTTASAAIRGANPEYDVEAYGVVGVTNSVYGAGVAAANTEGGPDLLLDGSFDSGTNTSLYEWGFDRSSPNDETLWVRNTGGGAITLDVFGTLRGTVLDCPGCVGSTALANESVTSDKIEFGGVSTGNIDFGAVTSSKIADGTIVSADLAEESVTSNAIEDRGVTEVDIAQGAVSGYHIFDGSIHAEDLAADAISSAAIADGSITTADLADGAVTSVKIQNGAVFTDQIDDSAITADKIAAGAVGTSQLAFESVGENQLADEAVTNSKIAVGAIDTTLLADGAVSGAKLADGSVGSTALRNNAVTTVKIAEGAVTGAKILNGSVTMADLAAESVGSNQIEFGGVDTDDINLLAVGTAQLADGAVTVAKLAAGAITGATIADGTITEEDLAIAAVTMTKIQDQAVGGSKIATGAVTNTKILAGAVTGDKLANGAVTGDKLANGAVTSQKVVSSEIQLRVASQCPVGSSIRSIDAAGVVTCETDDGADLTPPVEIIGTSNGVPVLLVSNTGTKGAIYAVTAAPTPSIYGLSNGEDGIGVTGEAIAISGVGLYGHSTTWVGVKGDGFIAGGQFEASHPDGIGIQAVGGLTGLAARFVGNVVIRDRDTGDDLIELGKGLDYAEGFNVSDVEPLDSGAVLVIDPSAPGELALSRQPYDTRVAGIIAGANGLGSGVRLGAGGFDHDVALAGRVYCKVDATAHGIEPGDLLTTATLAGYAMKATEPDRARGAILGKAMEPLEAGTTGQILVLVSLQ